MEISVIITNFNYSKFLARAIRSAIGQTIEKSSYEIIVADDCSTDNSREIINMFSASSNIRPIFNDENLGLAKTCNKAIKQAMGKYIIRVDADDYIHTDCLKVHKLFLENNKNDMDATSSDYYEVDYKEDVICRKNGTTWPIGCGVSFRTDHFLELECYNENLPREDVDFRQRFLKSGKHIYNISIPLYRYNQHKESLTRSESQNGKNSNVQ